MSNEMDAPNLADPAVQYRLATQWGYVRAAPAPVAPIWGRAVGALEPFKHVKQVLAAPAPVAPPVDWLRSLLDATMNFRHEPAGMVRGGEYVRADALIEAATNAAPAPVAPQPLTLEQIEAMYRAAQDHGISGIEPSIHFARAIERAHGIKGAQ